MGGSKAAAGAAGTHTAKRQPAWGVPQHVASCPTPQPKIQLIRKNIQPAGGGGSGAVAGGLALQCNAPRRTPHHTARHTAPPATQALTQRLDLRLVAVLPDVAHLRGEVGCVCVRGVGGGGGGPPAPRAGRPHTPHPPRLAAYTARAQRVCRNVQNASVRVRPRHTPRQRSGLTRNDSQHGMWTACFAGRCLGNLRAAAAQEQQRFSVCSAQ